MLLIITSRRLGPRPALPSRNTLPAHGRRIAPGLLSRPITHFPPSGQGAALGKNHQRREFRRLGLSPSPIQAGQEQSKLFPWRLGRPFIFKQDPVLEEDLPGFYRHHSPLLPPPSSARGQTLGPASCWGWEGGGSLRDSVREPGAGEGTACGNLQKEDADGKNKHTHTHPSTWISSWEKEKTPRGWMCRQKPTPTYASLPLSLRYFDYF